MLILKQPTYAEFMVKNSRFVAEAFPVCTPEAARELWHEQKIRYDNGGHIVYAFITGPQGNVMGCSDDGEPSGTAGKPMLAVVKGSGITNIIVTAARWFGGTKLGTGGLVRAYSDCARMALENAQTAELVAMDEITVTFNYPHYDLLKRCFAECGLEIISENFDSKITVHGKINAGIAAQFKSKLTEITGGQIMIR